MDHQQRARGSRLILAALLLLTASTVVDSQSSQEFAGLLQQEEHAEQARRVILGDWCQSQLARQTAQRNELRALRDQVAPLIGDDSNVHELVLREDNLGRRLEQKQSNAAESESSRSRTSAAVEDLRKQVDVLSRVQEKLPKDQRRKAFLQDQSSDDGGAVVATLLQSAQTDLQRLTAELAQHEPVMLQREVTKLESEHKAALDGLASLRTRQLAARKSQELIMAALEEQESFLTDLNDICELGQQVYGRFESKTLPAMKDVAKQLPSLASEASEAARLVPSRAAVAAPQPALEAEPVREASPAADDAAPTALLQPESDEPPAVPVEAAPRPPHRLRATAAARSRQKQQDSTDDVETAAPVSASTDKVSIATASQPSPADGAEEGEAPPAPPKKLKHSRSVHRKPRKKSRKLAKAKVRHTQVTTTKQMTTTSVPDVAQDQDAAADSDADADTATAEGQAESSHTKDTASAPDAAPSQKVRHGSSRAKSSAVELADNAAVGEESTPANEEDESGLEPRPARKKTRHSAPAARHTTTTAPVESQDTDIPSADPSTEEAASAGDAPPVRTSHHSHSQAQKPADSSDSMGEAAENSAAATDEGASDSDGDASASASLLNMPRRRAHHQHSEKPRPQQPLQDMVDVAAGAHGSDLDDKPRAAPEADMLADSRPPPPPFDHDFLSSPSRSRTPRGLEGGWKSFLKGSKRKKKHKTHDQGNGIMDLVNTPTTYTAWHPEHSDAQYTAAAKSDLKAAEAAFDAPDDSEPAGFLQLRSEQALGSRRADTAKLLLEQYADILKSPILLQLAHAQLGAKALRKLWVQLQSVNITVARSDHEAQSVQWCSDFQVESKALAKKTRVEQRQEALDLSQALTESLVLRQEIKAHSHFLQIASRDERSLQGLTGRVQHQFDSTAALLQQFQGEMSGILNDLGTGSPGHADLQAHVNSLQESLGRIQGEVDAGNLEITDIINTAASRRSGALTRWQANLAQVRASLADVEHRKSAIAAAGEAQKKAKDQNRSLRDRYNQMCEWVLGEYQERQRQQESEKRAIKAALTVLNLI
mmetsp:Transcript_30440/g.55758  ORF Transcript_30440/g.55758 Transcript_30440/m.55758 type:complete len:1055 (+) Transcript_30440:119-3283(+)